LERQPKFEQLGFPFFRRSFLRSVNFNFIIHLKLILFLFLHLSSFRLLAICSTFLRKPALSATLVVGNLILIRLSLFASFILISLSYLELYAQAFALFNSPLTVSCLWYFKKCFCFNYYLIFLVVVIVLVLR
jgi:hypothetical protein